MAVTTIPEWETAFSSGPVPPGYNYIVTFSYAIESDVDTYDGGGDGDCYPSGCTYMDYPVGYGSIDIPYPSPQISSNGLSPSSVYQGDQGTLTITGSNFVEYSGDQLTINFFGRRQPVHAHKYAIYVHNYVHGYFFIQLFRVPGGVVHSFRDEQ